ncbi:MAG: formate/nitrite transporter family protein [Deltaproteobacteria bacterium]|nr:formate/nitrite transporter family protein [Deltaproteobacteria bacterium]
MVSPPRDEPNRSAPPVEAGPAAGTRLSAAEIHENVRVAAEEELRRPVPELAWSGIAAGLTIGFSFLTGAFLTTLVPANYETAANAVGYPLGFIFVVLARNQLFTENTLEPIIPLLNDRRPKTLWRVLRLWAVVLSCNLAGALVFGLLLAWTPVVEPGVQAALYAVAGRATSGGFAEVCYLAVFAGWLIALMAWLVASTRATGAQIVLVWLTTAPIAALGFRHSIAGAVEAFYFAATGGATWGAMIGGFVVPAILGNILGGVTLVAFLNYGQVGTDPSPWARRRADTARHRQGVA